MLVRLGVAVVDLAASLGTGRSDAPVGQLIVHGMVDASVAHLAVEHVVVEDDGAHLLAVD
ncbi:hypothetical protein SDC9_204967 [bioreactor metagenome]|uniref:Uncharacterized protein n=1 Tax=bioreactor metagenome TaxID=1076179 RepID=A0A645JCK6_9ZZZZ